MLYAIYCFYYSQEACSITEASRFEARPSRVPYAIASHELAT